MSESRTKNGRSSTTQVSPTPTPEIQKAFQDLAEKWKSEIVSRDQIPVFTGGAISKGRMANLDSQGEGPPRFRMGRKVVYPVQSFIGWMIARCEPIAKRV